MQQRASICRALIHDPSLLMLDEPFGALDMFTREELWPAMQDLWLARRPTVILVTHMICARLYSSPTASLVMSGGGLAERAVEDCPARRALPMTYEPYAVGLVQELREHISAARKAA